MSWTASDFERLDPKLFRGFLAVVRSGSVSEAARIASLTQGAVSQQIARLEERLKCQLFVRANGRILPTDAAQLLAEFAESYLQSSSSFLERLNAEFESIQGLVAYSMPESCIHSPHFPQLLARRLEFPGIHLRVTLKPTDAVSRDVLGGEVDFGFVLEKRHEKQLIHHPFCVEEYGLVAAPSLHPRPLSHLDDIVRLPYVCFPESAFYLHRWLSGLARREMSPDADDLSVRGEFSDLRGAIAMVKGGMGATVLPLHVVADDLAAGRLVRIRHRDNDPPVTQQISICRLAERRLPARVRRVIRWFLEMHADLQPVPADFLN
ncbi:MAG TPA: LysR family transcriptional regulator [Zoogloea sp.]|uniref:LysR family transcriptional regulator n=1 Tax=Zoogloea sp. TaxID=49181 RepID=UPI002C8A1387|nr:LysR family transcriptional regulator [Zoogloea sp.]HMV17900.1 LysR family transcriptional regulator [Rhodocyclaceae bacterium]HMV63219.1 LysR family transcriptional regulator [Rhodocyclaceae bacterium]HMW52303.1 LysR family transcriptional regulator [Rhodocyclaceae bacterium]HMZ76703.1 LysR family transcriptional regulator [Rhodocyclaceae bacterium]HNA68615.1 LysR family transcriptional regulator [Rhodocyclaceae bacterium]